MEHRRVRTAVLLLLGVQLAAVVLFWAWELPQPQRVEGGESSVLTAVLLAKAGRPLYTHAAGLPLVQNPYGPVFEWICAWLPSVEGQPYLVGRVVSLLAMAGIGLLMASWLRSRQPGRVSALLPLALLFTAKPWILFGPLYRVDSLAVFLSLLGFWLVVLRQRASVAGALLTFTLALSVKLTALAAPVAAAVYLWREDRKRAVWLVSGLAVLLPGSVLALQAATDGAYLFNASFGNLPSHWAKGLELPSRVSLSLFWLAAVAVAVRGLGASLSARARALAIWALGSWALAGLFATNPLSSWNYLLEPYVALALLTGWLLARLDGSEPSHQVRGRFLKLLAVHSTLSLLIVAHTLRTTGREIRDYRGRYDYAYSRIAPLVAKGRSVLVLDSEAGRDVLNALERPNAVVVPPSVERRPEVQELIERELTGSPFDEVLVGPELACSSHRGP